MAGMTKADLQNRIAELEAQLAAMQPKQSAPAPELRIFNAKNSGEVFKKVMAAANLKNPREVLSKLGVRDLNEVPGAQTAEDLIKIIRL